MSGNAGDSTFVGSECDKSDSPVVSGGGVMDAVNAISRFLHISKILYIFLLERILFSEKLFSFFRN